MAAGLATHANDEEANPADPQAMPPARVLSVSPRHVPTHEGPRGASAWIVPRNHAQATLARVERETARLRECIARAAAHEMDLIETMHRIDERLALAAEVLVAFEDQITRMEHAIEQAHRLDQSTLTRQAL